MLFLATRLLEHDLNSEGRLRLLEKLDEEKFSPLIRQTRLGCFEQILADPKQAGEMERIFAASTRSEDESPYVQGDLFCFEDHIFFLLFGDSYRARGAMRVGIIYEPQMA